MRLIYELFKKHKACDDLANEFRRLFPNGCEPTIENLMILANQEYIPSCCPECPCRLNVTWLQNLLSYKEADEIWRIYDLVMNEHYMWTDNIGYEALIACLSQLLLEK